MKPILDQVRTLIKTGGVTRYRIYKDLGIDQGTLSKLMKGQTGLSFENVERLVDYLGHEIVIRPKQKGR